MSEETAPPSGAWSRRLGSIVEASRLRARLTRAEVAGRMQVSEETVRRWERGGSRPSEDRLAQLIAILAIDGAELARHEGDSELPELVRRLRDERAQRAITQAQAAAILSVAQPTYAGWEVGRATPDPALAPRVAAFLGLGVAEVAAITAVPFVVDTEGWPELGRLLGRRRERLRLTRQGLADRLGVTASAVVAWELGYRVPRLQQLPELAAALECPVDDLLRVLPAPSTSPLASLVRSRQGVLGLSQAEIARRAGTDAPTLSRWLNGHRRPDDGALAALARALDVPFAALRNAAVQ